MSQTPPKFLAFFQSLPLSAVLAILTALILVSAGTGYWISLRVHRSQAEAAPAQGPSSASPPSTDRKVLYWYDPMKPDQHFDKPGKSPFMEMQLLPKYADDGGSTTGIQISPRITQSLGLRLATVERGVLSPALEAVGSIGFNERNVAIVQARSSGFVARVYQRAPGDVIAREAPLVDLLVPEWAGAQSEFLALLKSGDQPLIDAARQRLVLLGMPGELISQIEASQQPRTTVTIRTPIAGAIVSLEVRAGMTVSAGATLARINGLETVWLEAAVPETQGALVGLGKTVRVQLSAYPGQDFKGQVIAILPEASLESRTLRVRVELSNAEGRLRPGMFARAHLKVGDAQPALFVPSEALIRTGVRTLLIVAAAEGRFEPTEVRIGTESNGKTAILSGVREGQRVVASGQFLIDSEASLRGALAHLGGEVSETTAAPQGTKPTPTATSVHEATGKIQSFAPGEIVISHGPIKSLGLEPMTMPFKLERAELAQGLKVGETVDFRFRVQDDEFVIEQVRKAGGGP